MKPENKLPERGLTKVYERPLWKHITRYIAFAGLMLIDFYLIAHSIIKPVQMSPKGLLALLLPYTVLLLVNAIVLPSIAMETNKVEVTEDFVIFYGLFFRTKVKWADITKIIAPRYLKFAIIKTDKFFHLVNKRDTRRFDELLQTLQERAINVAK